MFNAFVSALVAGSSSYLVHRGWYGFGFFVAFFALYFVVLNHHDDVEKWIKNVNRRMDLVKDGIDDVYEHLFSENEEDRKQPMEVGKRVAANHNGQGSSNSELPPAHGM